MDIDTGWRLTWAACWTMIFASYLPEMVWKFRGSVNSSEDQDEFDARQW